MKILDWRGGIGTSDGNESLGDANSDEESDGNMRDENDVGHAGGGQALGDVDGRDVGRRMRPRRGRK